MENNLIERKKDVEEVNTMSPLTWAYIGDCVFEMYVRMFFINATRLKPHAMHLEVIKHVKAEAQANLLKNISGELSDDEKDIVRRGRNAQNHHIPKNATLDDYSHATAYEALIGYLYLTKQDARLKEILELCKF